MEADEVGCGQATDADAELVVTVQFAGLDAYA